MVDNTFLCFHILDRSRLSIHRQPHCCIDTWSLNLRESGLRLEPTPFLQAWPNPLNLFKLNWPEQKVGWFDSYFLRQNIRQVLMLKSELSAPYRTGRCQMKNATRNSCSIPLKIPACTGRITKLIQNTNNHDIFVNFGVLKWFISKF